MTLHLGLRYVPASVVTDRQTDRTTTVPLAHARGLINATAISDDGARLDIAANGFWGGRSERAFFDVRVFSPHAPSNRQPRVGYARLLPTCYRKHENQKKRAYEQRVREVERGSFMDHSSGPVSYWWSRKCCLSVLQASGLSDFCQA